MKWMYLGVYLIASIFFLSGCSNDDAVKDADTKKDIIAVVDIDKVLKAHYLYPAWQNAVNSETATKKLKSRQVKMAQDQAELISKMEEIGQEGRNTFFQADYTIKMSELRVKEQERLINLRRVEKERADMLYQDKIDAIEEQYKIPIFNLKSKLESVNPLPFSKDEEKKLKEQWFEELEALQIEKMQKIDAIYQDREVEVDKAMISHEEEAERRLLSYAQEVYSEIDNLHTKQQQTVEERLALIPDVFAKTMASFDKQIDEQKIMQEKLHTRMMDDINSQVTKLAIQKKFTVVFSSIELNIEALDITEEIIAGLPKQ